MQDCCNVFYFQQREGELFETVFCLQKCLYENLHCSKKTVGLKFSIFHSKFLAFVVVVVKGILVFWHMYLCWFLIRLFFFSVLVTSCNLIY